MPTGGTQKRVARPERFELPTLCFEGRCSIQLSYGRILGYSLILLLLQLYFEFQLFDFSWSTWSRYVKSDANDLRFPKAGREVFVQSGVEFAHRFWLVTHPIIVDVFLTALAPKPRFPKPAKSVPRWEDYDGKTLSVKQSVWRKHTTDPKTASAAKPVPVIEALRDLLTELREAEGNPADGPILRGEKGWPLDLL
jgi:hypothetical protein